MGTNNRLFPLAVITRISAIGSSESDVLRDEEGDVTGTVRAHHDAVRSDVAKTIGPRLSGLEGNDSPVNIAIDA